jgi:uncharacterized protein with HEPN domain
MRHMSAAIEQIERFTAGLDLPAFTADDRTLRAVERCVEIISEASRDLPDDAKAEHPEINWRAMADAGNLYRHGYEFVDSQRLWETVLRDIGPLKSALAAIGGKQGQPGGKGD